MICGATAAVGNRKKLIHIASVEVRHSPRTDQAVGSKRFEAGDGVHKRNAAAPVQQVEVEMIGSQALEAALAGGNRSMPGRVVRVDLADQKNLVALPFDRATHYFLCAAIAIHLGGVDQRHAEIDSQLQRRDFALALPCPLAHLPCPQADDGHERA